MLIKRYRVDRKSEANARILKELGPEALVLTSMPTADGRKYIVTAGIDKEDFAHYRGPDTPFPEDDQEEAVVAENKPVSTASQALEKLLQKSIDNTPSPPSRIMTTSKLAASLITRGLDKTIAETIDAAVAKKFPGVDLSTNGPERNDFFQELCQQLLPFLPMGGRIPCGETSPYVIALAGPQAVGRSTALAKIAQQKREGTTALITFSNEQLYAPLRQKEVALHVVSDRTSLVEALKQCHQHHTILIDLPAAHPGNTEQMIALEQLLKGIPHLEVHLVLSAAMKSDDQLHALYSYQSLNPKSLVLTMIDQTRTPISIANALTRKKLQISLVSTANDIMVADPTHFVYNLLFEKGFGLESARSHVN